MEKSPFAQAAPELVAKGFSVVPIKRKDKGPIPKRWQELSHRANTPEEIQKWSMISGANIGLVLGKASGLVALDYDNYPEFWEEVVSILPQSPVTKKGAKGFTAFYRYSGQKNLSWKYRDPKTGRSETVIDLLSDGRQTVIPPSIHPKGFPYVWTSRRVVIDVLLDGYPQLGEEEIELICEVLERFDAKCSRMTEPRGEPFQGPGVDFNEAQELLSYIHPDLDYDSWSKVGMGLKAEFGDSAYPLWDSWSSEGQKYSGPDDTRKHWESFQKTGITIGTVIKFAQEEGYDPRVPKDSDFINIWSEGAIAKMEQLEQEINASSSNGQPKEQKEQKEQKEPTKQKPNIIPRLKYPWTDAGNAERFIFYFGNDFRYTGAYKWMHYDGIRWKKKAEAQALNAARETADNIIYEKERYSTTDESKKAFNRWLQTSHSADKIGAMLRVAKNIPGIHVEDADIFDRDIWYLNCLNGTLDLRTGKLQPHDRKLYSTRMTSITYDPEASCPMWMDYLRLVMDNDQEMIDYLQRVAGYCLTGCTGEHVLFFIFGDGQNGKSVFIETLSSLAGDYGTVISTRALCLGNSGNTTDEQVARSAGARLITVGETQIGQTWDESLLKDMTGGDRVTACLKFCDSFVFTPRSKILIRGNVKPNVKGTDEGIWRRFHLIPFEVPIPKEQVVLDFKEQLWANELPGILAWAVEGCLAWQKQGLQPPNVVAKAVKDYREESDLVGRFINDCVDFHSDLIWDETPGVYAVDLYKEFKKWTILQGEHTWSNRRFGEVMKLKLRQRFPTKENDQLWCRVNKGIVYKGVKINPDFVEICDNSPQLWGNYDKTSRKSSNYV